MSYPNLIFEADEQVEPLLSQSNNMQKKWEEVQDEVLRSINDLVNIRWRIKEVLVQNHQRLYEPEYCGGYVYPESPRVIHIEMGRRVNGGGSKALRVLFHELIHSLVMSTRRSSFFKKSGMLEEWIFDELATDYLAQHVSHHVLGTEVRTIDSLDYALHEIGRQVIEDRDRKDVRDKIVRNIDRKFKAYEPSGGMRYHSFRKMLMTV